MKPEVFQKGTEHLKKADPLLAALIKEYGNGRLQLDKIAGLPNESILKELIQVKGIGSWTAEMFLLFALGRTDVFPLDDLGIKRAIQIQYGMEDLPSKAEMEQIGAAWAPYESIVCLYLWQSLNNKPSV
ncbi:DNA-3-methyladenine glycosylase family protein [Aneurinibacillus terranovensis]|uniref:DNA-3-methyladenine glycosylase family protein n=1 Tax=Aneurinibacillus terranovensis TaxID=278991 RepID=UPI0004078141|nr:DNA-3-methyladenine glycosylase [Aneurinibacillus terranovensis]